MYFPVCLPSRDTLFCHHGSNRLLRLQRWVHGKPGVHLQQVLRQHRRHRAGHRCRRGCCNHFSCRDCVPCIGGSGDRLVASFLRATSAIYTLTSHQDHHRSVANLNPGDCFSIFRSVVCIGFELFCGSNVPITRERVPRGLIFIRRRRATPMVNFIFTTCLRVSFSSFFFSSLPP